MVTGDQIIFCRNEGNVYRLFCKGTIVGKSISEEFSSTLWKKDEYGRPFCSMFYIDNRETINIPFMAEDLGRDDLDGFMRGSQLLEPNNKNEDVYWSFYEYINE